MKIIRGSKEYAEKAIAYLKQIGDETDNLTFNSKLFKMTVEQEKEYLESIKESNDEGYFIALQDDKIVSIGCFSRFKKERLKHRGEISISVLKDCWGKHIGTKMMEVLMDFARNVSNVKIVSLEVRSDNVRAINLYKKFGFNKIGTFKGYMQINGELIDCDIMELIF